MGIERSIKEGRLTKKIEAYRATIAKLRKTRTSLREQVAALEHESRNLHAQLDEAKVWETEEAMRARNIETQGYADKLNAQEAEIRDLNQKLTHSRGEVERLHNKLSAQVRAHVEVKDKLEGELVEHAHNESELRVQLEEALKDGFSDDGMLTITLTEEQVDFVADESAKQGLAAFHFLKNLVDFFLKKHAGPVAPTNYHCGEQDAVINAGFYVERDITGKQTLWCNECKRDSGMHWSTCTKATMQEQASAVEPVTNWERSEISRLNGLLVESSKEVDKLIESIKANGVTYREALAGLRKDNAELKGELDRRVTALEGSALLAVEALASPPEFKECPKCAAKPGSPELCNACYQRRGRVNKYNEEHKPDTRISRIIGLIRAIKKSDPKHDKAHVEIGEKEESVPLHSRYYAIASHNTGNIRGDTGATLDAALSLLLAGLEKDAREHMEKMGKALVGS